VNTTVIRTSQPARFAAVTAASGIGLSPFRLDAPASTRTNAGFHAVRLPVILSRGVMSRAMPRFVVLEGGAAQRARIPGGGVGPAGHIKSA
jgi:hypothetical protein